MSKLYEDTKQFVLNIFKNKEVVYLVHFERTVYWIKRLKNDADDALLIAGLAHDIEKGFPNSIKKLHQKIKVSSFSDREFLRIHQNNCAKIIGDFLKNQGASQDMIDRVRMLVSRHEEGGTDDQNLLKDADSISFFENNINHILTKELKKFGKTKVRQKFDWMFSRITNESARQIAKPMYEKSLIKLKESS